MGNGMNIGPECPWDSVLQEDLEAVAADEALAAGLRGKRILVTGATGLVGSQLIRALACMNRVRNNRMTILGVIRSQEKARTIYGEEFLEREDVHLLTGDILSPELPDLLLDLMEWEAGILPTEEGEPAEEGRVSAVDIVIHGASVTASRMMVERPVETIMTAVTGTKNMLDFAREAGASSFVYLSSMEMYGNLAAGSGRPGAVSKDDGDGLKTQVSKETGIVSAAQEKDGRGIMYPAEMEIGDPDGSGGDPDMKVAVPDTVATEDRLGWLDLMNVRSDYPESKRLCENLCVGYGKEYGLNVKIARLAQTFGAGIPAGENRVFAQFARSVLRGEDIVLHTRGLSEGNYCYTRDAVRGILTIAVRGGSGRAYNVANEEAHTTIAGMAQLVAEKIAGGLIRVVYDIPKGNVYGYAADTLLRLDSSKLRALGWEPEVGLEEMYRRLIASMKAGRGGDSNEWCENAREDAADRGGVL